MCKYGVGTKYLSHFLTEPHVAQQVLTITYAIKKQEPDCLWTVTLFPDSILQVY